MSEEVVPDREGDGITIGFDVGGIIIPSIGDNVSVEAAKSIFDRLPDYKYRQDDIMLCTYPKTGTNWMYEILSMINNKSAEQVKSNKVATMMEVFTASKLDEKPSPRVLNSHLALRLMHNMSEEVVPDREGDGITIGFDVGGIIIPSIGDNVSVEAAKSIFDRLPDYKYRQDDIMLCTYPKTGTNWMYEILSMINNKSAEQVKSNKVATMMEVFTASKLDEKPSPRVLNSHLALRFLPKDLRVTKPKTVLCVRNPKDTAVSFFNHIKGKIACNYNGRFSNWLQPYMEGKLAYGRYTDYLKEWEKAINDGIDFPLHVLHYENLKLDGQKELDRLLKFLEVDLDETLKSDILEACSFENMAKNKKPSGMMKKAFKNDFSFFRKGQIGDWKNWFSIADNEMFDSIWEAEMKDSKLFKFTYTDPRTNKGN